MSCFLTASERKEDCYLAEYGLEAGSTTVIEQWKGGMVIEKGELINMNMESGVDVSLVA